MNAHVIRLDALGRRLTEMANLDKGEFNFDSEPAVGGPEGLVEGATVAAPDLTAMLDDLTHQIRDRERQLSVLESMISTRNLSRQVVPDGRPVLQGWISSHFGYRADPFTGRNAYHRGSTSPARRARRWSRSPRAWSPIPRTASATADGRDQSRQRLCHPLRAQPEGAGAGRRYRPKRPGHRADRLHRPLHRPAPAFRSAEAGPGRGSDEFVQSLSRDCRRAALRPTACGFPSVGL